MLLGKGMECPIEGPCNFKEETEASGEALAGGILGSSVKEMPRVSKEERDG